MTERAPRRIPDLDFDHYSRSQDINLSSHPYSEKTMPPLVGASTSEIAAALLYQKPGTDPLIVLSGDKNPEIRLTFEEAEELIGQILSALAQGRAA